MKERVVTALIAFLLLLLVLFALPPAAVRFVFAIVLLAGAWEWSAFLRFPGLAVRVGYVAVTGMLIVAVSLAPPALGRTILEVSLVWWCLALIWAFFFPTPIPAFVRWLAGPVVLVPLYVALTSLYFVGPVTLLFALLIVWAADSGAFFVGRTVGRVKLAPKISPGKTWEGAVGGLVAVVLLTLLWSAWSHADLQVFVPFCLAVACLSIVGDLTVSMFKRDAGLKDSGALFPGHGGVLDRIDSIAAAAPLFALGASWAGLR
jgi:phosphatidate cytidylyltransferase